jgi:hypothetical protein
VIGCERREAVSRHPLGCLGGQEASLLTLLHRDDPGPFPDEEACVSKDDDDGAVVVGEREVLLDFESLTLEFAVVRHKHLVTVARRGNNIPLDGDGLFDSAHVTPASVPTVL